MWVRFPVYSSGDRTSISGWLPMMSRTSSLKARIGSSLRCTTGEPVGRRVGTSTAGSPPPENPKGAPAVEESHGGVADQREDPQRVGRPPVALVAVDHHGVIARDALAIHQLGELLAADVIADSRVVEIGVPVDLDGAGDVPDVVEQDILVGLHDRQTGGAQVGGDPVGGDQSLRVRVGRQSGAWVG